MKLFEGAKQAASTLASIQALRNGKLDPELDSRLAALAGLPNVRRRGRRSIDSEETLSGIRGALTGLMGLIESSDQVPTSQAAAAANNRLDALTRLTAHWESL